MNETVTLDEGRGALAIIDQTLLPAREEAIYLTTPEETREAIYRLRVRGAPAIGVAAAIGAYLGAKAVARKILDCNARNAASAATATECRDAASASAAGCHDAADEAITAECGDTRDAVAAATTAAACETRAQRDFDDFIAEFRTIIAMLASARPTAVNLEWALRRMERAALGGRGEALPAVVERLRVECLAIKDEDSRVCEAIGRRGIELLKPGMGLLTHCNAGRLATASSYGTATAPIYVGQELGYGFKVYCDETRPLLQGARLTAYELNAAGVDATLICDNMAPSLMASGRIDAVLVGCDRVAANGDAANKIGTLYVAIAAKRYGIPFYVCAPTSTIDFSCVSGDDIVIEQRPAEEVAEMWFAARMTPAGVKIFNPAFDVTGADLITAIITERGVVYPPFRENLEYIRTGHNDG